MTPNPPQMSEEDVRKRASEMLKSVSVPEIMRQLRGEELKLLREEIVVRPGLLERFDSKRKELAGTSSVSAGLDALPSDTDLEAGDLAKIEIIYHGTSLKGIDRIVEKGFAVPGYQNLNREEDYLKSLGDFWGAGIYCCRDPLAALHQTGWDGAGYAKPGPQGVARYKIMVCAILMGRRKQLKDAEDTYYKDETRPDEGFHSLVVPGGHGYVVYDPAQLLPLMVMHLDEDYVAVAKRREAWELEKKRVAAVPGQEGGEEGKRVDGGKERKKSRHR